jgi:hypothetical protein
VQQIQKVAVRSEPCGRRMKTSWCFSLFWSAVPSTTPQTCECARTHAHVHACVYVFSVCAFVCASERAAVSACVFVCERESVCVSV